MMCRCGHPRENHKTATGPVSHLSYERCYPLEDGRVSGEKTCRCQGFEEPSKDPQYLTCTCGHPKSSHSRVESGPMADGPYDECTEVDGLNFCDCLKYVHIGYGYFGTNNWLLYERDYAFLPWKNVSKGTKESQERSGEERRRYNRIGQATGLNPVPAEFCVVQKDSPAHVALKEENAFLKGPTAYTIKDAWMRDNRNPLALLEFKMDTIILQMTKVATLLNEEMLKGKIGSTKASMLLLQLDSGTMQLHTLARAYTEINYKNGGKIPLRFYHLT